MADPVTTTEIHDKSKQLKKQFVTVRNIRHGYYKEWYENGNLKIEANFVAGKLHGVYIDKFESGNLRLRQQYEHGVLHGETIGYHDTKWESRSVLTFYNKGNRYGTVTAWWENGEIRLVERYKDGLRHGISSNYYWWGIGLPYLCE